MILVDALLKALSLISWNQEQIMQVLNIKGYAVVEIQTNSSNGIGGHGVIFEYF